MESTRQRQSATIAHVVSRFPKISETFVLHEMMHLRDTHGVAIELFALVRQRTNAMHRDCVPFLRRLHSRPALSQDVLAAQFFWCARRPRTYALLWLQVVGASVLKPHVFIRSVVVLLKSALFARRAMSLGVDHIHAHFATHPALAAYCMHRLSRIPFSFTAHAHDIYMPDQRHLLIEKCRAAIGVVTISEYNRLLLGWLCGTRITRQTHVIRCGVDTRKYRPSQLSAHRGPLVVCVASLEPYKGHEYLLRACSLLRCRGIPFGCLCIGGGRSLDKLRRLAREEKLHGEIRFLGPQPEHRVHRLLRRATVFAHPSVVMPDGRADGVPVALMEAMAMGIPCVSTRVTGIPELVEDGTTGLLVAERDAVGLADAIERLLLDPVLCRRIAAQARARVTREYDRHANVDKLARLLVPMATRKRSATQPDREPTAPRGGMARATELTHAFTT